MLGFPIPVVIIRVSSSHHQVYHHQVLMFKNVDGIMSYVHIQVYAFCKNVHLWLPANVLVLLCRFAGVSMCMYIYIYFF